MAENLLFSAIKLSYCKGVCSPDSGTNITANTINYFFAFWITDYGYHVRLDYQLELDLFLFPNLV